MSLGAKPYCQPIKCGFDRPHYPNREGFFHCSGCGMDRPRWDFYTNRETGDRIEGGCIECRRKKGRKGGSMSVGGCERGRPRGTYTATAPEREVRGRTYTGRTGKTVPIRDPKTGKIMGSRSLGKAGKVT